MGEPYAYIDDEFKKASEAKISILEPTFNKGDSVYDTVSVLNKMIFRLDDHLSRFENSCEQMEIKIPYSRQEVKSICIKLVEKSQFKDAIFSLIGRRGPYTDFTKRDLRTCKNGLIVVVVPLYNIFGMEKEKDGLKVSIVQNRRVPKEAIDATVKNYNWMDLNRGSLQAYKNGDDTAVLCTPDGYLSEGPGFNIWIIKDGKLFTPKGNLLEGITRKSVFEIAHELGLEAQERTLKPIDLEEADEAFSCTTAAGITPITHVNGKSLGNGHPGISSIKIQTTYWEKRKQGWHGTAV